MPRLETLRLPNGASNGLVLTSDANGNATWQAVSGGGGGSQWSSGAGPPAPVLKGEIAGAATSGAGATTLAVPIAQAIPAGMLVTLACISQSSRVFSSMSDPRSNTWVSGVNANGWSVVYSVLSTGLQAGDTLTITFGGAASVVTAVGAWWAGINPSTPVDVMATSQATGSGPNALARSITTTQVNDLVLGAFLAYVTPKTGDAGQITTPGAGYSNLARMTGTHDGFNFALALDWEYKVAGAAGAEQPPATWSSTASYGAVTASFRAARATVGTLGQWYLDTTTSEVYEYTASGWVRRMGGVSLPYAVTAGYAKDRAFNPTATTINEIAGVLGTLIDDLKAAGLIAP